MSDQSNALAETLMRTVVIENDLEGSEAELIARLGLGRRFAVVSDPDTFEAMGARIVRALDSKFQVQNLILGNQPHPDERTLKGLAESLDVKTDAIIAVGSGTINDLCKMAAFQRGCPQAVFGTAPSMNGYASVNAAITVNGLKKSLHAAAPAGVFLDLRVLAKAPKRLIRAGLGDSLCRPTAQADWLLAHLLWDQPYNNAPFELLAEDEGALFAKAGALLSGDLEAMRRLARTLVLSGIGMTICGGSYPASQGEHLISHYIDMMGSRGGTPLPEAFHGEQIGVTTLAMAELQGRILGSETPPTVQATALRREDVVAHFGPALGEACWREFEAKWLDQEKADALNRKLEKHWGMIRSRIQSVSLSSATLREALKAAGAPTTPQELGWPRSLYRQALQHARELRDRYTFLDLAAESISTGFPGVSND